MPFDENYILFKMPTGPEITEKINLLTANLDKINNDVTIVRIEEFDTEDEETIAESVNEIFDSGRKIDMETLAFKIYNIDHIMSSSSELQSFLNKYYNTIFYVALYAKKIAYQRYRDSENFRSIINNAEHILIMLEKLPKEQKQLPLQEQLQEPKRGFFSRLFGKKKKGGKSKRRKTKKKKTKTKTKKTKK
jgi:hypothetical protein